MVLTKCQIQLSDEVYQYMQCESHQKQSFITEYNAKKHQLYVLYLLSNNKHIKIPFNCELFLTNHYIESLSIHYFKHISNHTDDDNTAIFYSLIVSIGDETLTIVYDTYLHTNTIYFANNHKLIISKSHGLEEVCTSAELISRFHAYNITSEIVLQYVKAQTRSSIQNYWDSIELTNPKLDMRFILFAHLIYKFSTDNKNRTLFPLETIYTSCVETNHVLFPNICQCDK
jgi:hypothetical protein